MHDDGVEQTGGELAVKVANHMPVLSTARQTRLLQASDEKTPCQSPICLAQN